MNEYGVGIIGAGWVAGEYIRACDSHPATEVRAICSRSPEKAKARAAECGVHCDIAKDFEELVARDDIHIVAVASPPNCHRDQAVAAAQAGKHLVLEKAMATTLEDSKAIRDAVAQSGVKSVVSFVLRWNPLFELIKSQIADGAIGNVFLGEVDYFHGIGPWYAQYHWNVKKEVGASSLLSAGCHAVDAVRWFMGGEVEEVTQYATFGKAPEFKEYEYNPTSVTILKFKDGRVGKVTSCIECLQPYVFHINLVGTRGTIRNNQIYSKEKFLGQTGWAVVPTILPDSGDVTHHPFSDEVGHLVSCIESGTESHVNVADAYKTHEIVFAADRSGIEGKPVRLPL
jgi:predicted dehydrogenase